MIEMIVCPYCQIKVISNPKPGKTCECGGVLPKGGLLKKLIVK